MSKDTKKADELPLRSLVDVILLAALGNVAHVLRPYPDDAKPEDIDSAIATLRARGLVQGTDREPNLTRLGVEAAQDLAAKA